MSDHEHEHDEAAADLDTDATDTGAGEVDGDGRCPANVEMSTGTYQCALQDGHEGEHSFASVDDTDTGEPSELDLAAAASAEEEKAMRRAVGNYSKKLIEILGPDLGPFEACALCSDTVPGLWLEHDLKPEQVNALRHILGLPDLSNYRGEKYSNRCQTCDGYGICLTGSRDPKFATIQCFDCKGRGWMPVGDERRIGGALDGVPVPTGVTVEDQAAAPALPPAAVEALRTMLNGAELAAQGL